MELVPVSSSNLAAVGFDPDASILEILFKSGSLYRYFEVPSSVHAALMSASSRGSYFNAHIKEGPYRYERVR